MQMIGKNKYGSYSVPESSSWRVCAQQILAGKVYEPDTISYMIENCGDGSIIHAGTYFGDFLPALSRHCQNTVYAFEPNTENYEHARATCDMNDCWNVDLHHYALGNDETMVNLEVTSHGRSAGGISKVVSFASDKTERVKQVRLDDVIPDEPISILQLDVEGHEALAIEGALRIIEENNPIIIVEGKNAFDILQQLEYKLIKHIHLNTVWKRTLNNGET